MSQNNKPPYTSEFKQSAVKLTVEGEKTAAQTARDPGANENTLHTWINKYHRKPAQENTEVDSAALCMPALTFS